MVGVPRLPPAARRGLGGPAARGPAAGLGRPGDHRYDDRLPSVAPGGPRAARPQRRRAMLARLQAIDRAAPRRRRTASTTTCSRASCATTSPSYELGAWQMPFNADSGFHTGFAQLPRRRAARHGQRLRELHRPPARLAALRARSRSRNMRAGLRTGMTHAARRPRRLRRRPSAPTSSTIPTKSVFWAPFAQLPGRRARGASASACARRAARPSMEGAVAGYRALPRLLTERVPARRARPPSAPRSCRDGRAYYAHQVRQLHDPRPHARGDPPDRPRRGGADPARRCDAVMRQAGFQGDFAAFLEFLRTDPRFYAKTAEELLKEASWIAKRMDGKLPALFGTPAAPALHRRAGARRTSRPSTPPAATSSRRWAARGRASTGSTPTSSRAGRSTTWRRSPSTRPCRAITCRSRCSRSWQGLPALPPLRLARRFGEGWGLYSEWLGLEAGFYTDPYSNFGRLTYEMWRACRLVVDTGMHAMGWTRAAGHRLPGLAHRAARCTRCGPRPTATSPGPARPSPTRWAS